MHTFGGEIPRVPGAVIKNTCLIVWRLLSLQLRLFTASFRDFKFQSQRMIQVAGDLRGSSGPNLDSKEGQLTSVCNFPATSLDLLSHVGGYAEQGGPLLFQTFFNMLGGKLDLCCEPQLHLTLFLSLADSGLQTSQKTQSWQRKKYLEALLRHRAQYTSEVLASRCNQ